MVPSVLRGLLPACIYVLSADGLRLALLRSVLWTANLRVLRIRPIQVWSLLELMCGSY
jgi:hypothetical protein